MKNKKILLMVCGSIAAYKAASLVSFLHSRGDKVKVMMTDSATKFITPLTFQSLSRQKVSVGQFDGEEEIIEHIYYPQHYDLIVVAPATANIIGKAANGIADDIVSSSLLASDIPILFVPSMNTVMYNHPSVQLNLNTLKKNGCHIVEPATGRLACGEEGIGKYPGTKKIVEKIDKIWRENYE